MSRASKSPGVVVSGEIKVLSSIGSERREVAVTGFYAAWRESDGWCEVCEDGVTLPALFAADRIDNISVTAQSRVVEEVGTRVSAGELLKKRLDERVVSFADSVEPERLGVSFASSKGFSFWVEPQHKGEWLAAGSSCDRPASALAHLLRARGPILSPVAACATGAHALALAALQVENSYADIMLAGALEFPAPPLVMAGYASLGALSRSGVMRPFDRDRDGFVPNTGMGWLILEDAARAHARKARIYAYLTGWSLRADATSMTGMCPSGSSIACAIADATRRSAAPSVGYINAHGTATMMNDAVETRGIQSVYGAGVPVSSTKPLTGHLLGAAGAVEAVLSLLVLRDSFLPPTLNLREPDALCSLDYIPQRGREARVDSVLSLSYGFGGHIGALVFEGETGHATRPGR